MKFIRTQRYKRREGKRMSEEEVQAMESELITNPLRGIVLRQTGGFRKARFAVRGRGKSGGVRVVYYYMTKNKQIILWSRV